MSEIKNQLSANDQLLPCPFCRSSAAIKREWSMPPGVTIFCTANYKLCPFNPRLFIEARCTRNEGELETYRPEFLEAECKAVGAWNKRA